MYYAEAVEIYPLSLHDVFRSQALIEQAFEDRAAIGPQTTGDVRDAVEKALDLLDRGKARVEQVERLFRSEEHTSELQSHSDVVCRLLLEKKKHQPRQTAIKIT